MLQYVHDHFLNTPPSFVNQFSYVSLCIICLCMFLLVLFNVCLKMHLMVFIYTFFFLRDRVGFVLPRQVLQFTQN